MYGSHVDWANAFSCPVYTSAEDSQWLMRTSDRRRLITSARETILPDVVAVKTGGHFDGSLVLHWEKKLFIADTLITAQVSSLGFALSRWCVVCATNT
jgi:glyoxylase-like metal-dependent hydrolase (beta-lactamase superfamily II)